MRKDLFSAASRTLCALLCLLLALSIMLQSAPVAQAAKPEYYPNTTMYLRYAEDTLIPMFDSEIEYLPDQYVIKAACDDPDRLKVWVKGGECWARVLQPGACTVRMETKSAVSYLEVFCQFADVDGFDKYYFFPVEWALNTGITTGTGKGRFSPNATCTRAEFVTFLYRYAASPSVYSLPNPFSDVPEGAFYADAVKWAYSCGITTGTGNGRFSPNAPCTREQAITFIWRYFHEPNPYQLSPYFKDAPEGKYYSRAINWAKEYGITTGVSADKFGVGQRCTRGMLVTYLYRTPHG